MRETYAHKALLSLPRLLGNQDRNPFSPTYGSFHRDYWLDKTSDFPDAVRQFSSHALALAYKHPMPHNPYYGQAQVREWAVAGLAFWASIQHGEGSFDEFYPYERGWVGPSAFTAYTSIEAYNLLADEIDATRKQRILDAIHKAAVFIGKGESEEDHLANHHAMACLALWKAYELFNEPLLLNAYEQAWQTFLTYHNAEEGWSREYDGVDPGYLSATVSFLGKVYQTNPDPAIKAVLEKAVEFSAYFVYPNGFYAGSTGSRNTLHFYPHGYEILADEMPLAKAIAERMLQALGENKLVPPEIISDRYVVYRVPEFLLAYIDYKEREETLASLPYEQPPFRRYFEQSRIFVDNTKTHYTIANLAKGGVIKRFDKSSEQLVYNDAGIIGETQDGTVISSQWIDPLYQVVVLDNGWEVSGWLNEVPPHRVFNPLKQILFRGTLLAMGWNSDAAHWLKGQIRKTLILNQQTASACFQRRMHFEASGNANVTDTISLYDGLQLKRLQVGGEFFVRYVPQSRYFQSQELGIASLDMTGEHVNQLNAGQTLTVQRAAEATPTYAVSFTSGYAARQGKKLATSAPSFARSGVDVTQQKIYWENKTARRHPSDPVVEAFAAPKVNTIRQHTQIETLENPQILDVGCGNGYFTYYLEKLGKVYGVDFARTMLDSNPVGILSQGSALELPFPSQVFDLVFCSNLLHHLPQPVAAMQEMGRVSSRYVVISEPNRNNPAMLALGIMKQEERESLRFTRRYLEGIVHQAGLRLLHSETAGFITPNRMPRPIVRMLQSIGIEETPHPLGAYHVLICERI